MNKTKIEWVKNPDGTQGYTWNPITGCLNHVNGLCKGGGFPCYAYKLAHGRLRRKYLANPYVPCYVPYYSIIGTIQLYVAEAQKDPFYPRFWKERECSPITFEKPHKSKGIFVCDMGELFGNWIPIEWQEHIFATIQACPQHRFYLLTKQPQNLIEFSPFPNNCWVGVTATSPKMFIDALAGLEFVEAMVKFISIEPYLIRIPKRIIEDYGHYIDWVIIGSQTKPFNPPSINKVEETVRACDKAGVPVFLKNNLEPLFLEKFPPKPFENFGCWNLPDWAVDNEAENRDLLKLRQEMPD